MKDIKFHKDPGVNFLCKNHCQTTQKRIDCEGEKIITLAITSQLCRD